MFRRVFIMLMVLISIGFGAKEKKGQRYYLKRCGGCHGSGKMWGNVATQDEWREFFTKNINDLKDFHKDNPKVLRYLTSKEFKKEKGRMSKFMQEFASDSPYIPSCNN